MSRTCRKSFVDMMIDVRDGQGRPRHFCWTRRRHNLDQSILIRTNVDNQRPYRSSIRNNSSHLDYTWPTASYVRKNADITSENTLTTASTATPRDASSIRLRVAPVVPGRCAALRGSDTCRGPPEQGLEERRCIEWDM